MDKPRTSTVCVAHWASTRRAPCVKYERVCEAVRGRQERERECRASRTTELIANGIEVMLCVIAGLCENMPKGLDLEEF